jgi:hypothetical protein
MALDTGEVISSQIKLDCPIEALMLAQQLAEQLLGSHFERSGHILDGPGGAPLSLERIFNSGCET